MPPFLRRRRSCALTTCSSTRPSLRSTRAVAFNRKSAAWKNRPPMRQLFTATATGRLILLVAARGICRAGAATGLAWDADPSRFARPIPHGERPCRLTANAGAGRATVAEDAVRVRRHFFAGGSGSLIGPSAPWTAFEYKNCTGTRLPPVLLRTSWNTRCKCPSWPAMAIG